MKDPIGAVQESTQAAAADDSFAAQENTSSPVDLPLPTLEEVLGQNFIVGFDGKEMTAGYLFVATKNHFYCFEHHWN